MRTKMILCQAICLLIASSCFAQKQVPDGENKIIPYAGVIVGGCGIDNPVSFLAGIQQQKKMHLSIACDIHVINTGYECYCEDNVVSKGHFSSFTPSVKLWYNTGRKTSRGFMAGVGLGWMFAKDRGTEETYTTDPVTLKRAFSGEIVNGKWDFNSLSPSISFGIGFRVFHFPVSLNNSFYFANTTEGWMPVAGGVGCKIGLKRL